MLWALFTIRERPGQDESPGKSRNKCTNIAAAIGWGGRFGIIRLSDPKLLRRRQLRSDREAYDGSASDASHAQTKMTPHAKCKLRLVRAGTGRPTRGPANKVR